jgi:hypothetical protein
VKRSSAGNSIRWSTIISNHWRDPRVPAAPQGIGLLSFSLSRLRLGPRCCTTCIAVTTAKQVDQSLSLPADAGIPYNGSLLLGAPGETPETIRETLNVIDRYPVPGLSVTIGINLWTHHQPLVAELQKTGELPETVNLFDEAHYISPELPEGFMRKLIEDLNARNNCSVFVFKPYAGYTWPEEYWIT